MQKEEGQERGGETSRRARGLAIFQWDLLEHHSKALRPPGRAGRLPSPWHFHLVPYYSTLSRVRARLRQAKEKEKEKGLRGREALARARSLSSTPSRLVSTRREEGQLN